MQSPVQPSPPFPPARRAAGFAPPGFAPLGSARLRVGARAVLALVLALALVLPAASAGAELAFRGWGLRGGVASDPDQGIVGVHLDMGQVTEMVRIQPSLEAGFGDADSVQLLIPAHVVFDTGGELTPYVGGGVLVAWVDYDEPRRSIFGTTTDDGDEVDVAPVAVGGLAWRVDSRHEVLLELQLGGSEAFDAKFVVGWSF